MALDTLASIRGKILARVPIVSPYLADDWISNAFRRLYEYREWSWRRKRSQFVMPVAYTTGTVTVTQGDATVEGSGTTWTSVMAGRQFRASTSNIIYTIASVTDGDTLELDQTWGPATATGKTYTIWQAYVTPATDFQSFLSVVDVENGVKLHTGLSQEYLDQMDPERTNSGDPVAIAALDYSAAASSVPGYPRYEIWPHVETAMTIPYSYIAIPSDLGDSGALLPRFVRGDILLEMALAEAARWPGPSAEKPNPYFNLQLADRHEVKAELLLNDLETQDENIYQTVIEYQDMPYATLPFIGGTWWQSHDA